MKKILLTITLILFVFAAMAQSDRKKIVIYTIPFVPEHEFRLGVGFLPITRGTWDEVYSNDYLIIPPYGGDYYETQDNSTTCAINLSYTYRVKRWLEVGAILSYNGDYDDVYFHRDGSRYFVGNRNTTDISFVPMVRFSWYRSKYVRLYSAVGFGMTFTADSYKNDKGTDRRFDCGFATQLTPFGISAGKRLFGFAELYGVGVSGAVTVGIGYRLADKNAKVARTIKY